MKNIAISFDDGRWDTFSNAFTVLKKYKLKATIYVISGFVLEPDNFSLGNCKKSGAMTVNQIKQCVDYGCEIGCHGANHDNTIDGIYANIKDFTEMGIPTDNIGFASPYSEINRENNSNVVNLINNGTLSYVRSGIRTKEKGLAYCVLKLLEQITHSKHLFYFMNKENIIKKLDCTYIPSIGITKYTTNKQVEYLISKMSDGDKAILTFHSVLKSHDEGRDGGKWFWDYDRFERLCSYIDIKDDVKIHTVKEMVDME